MSALSNAFTNALIYEGLIQICDVTGQNQVLVATCHLPQIQFSVILQCKIFLKEAYKH